MQNTKSKHCKFSYQVIVPYSEITNSFVIEIGGSEYKVDRIPKPKTDADCYAAYVNGIRYSTFAKFLKSLSIQ